MITNKQEKDHYCSNKRVPIQIVMQEDFEELHGCSLKMFKGKEYTIVIWKFDNHPNLGWAISFFLENTKENKINISYEGPSHMKYHEVQIKMFTDRFDIIN